MIKTVLFAAAAALATVATASPVLAKDVVVHYGDLDLATAKGQTTFAHRIHRAARRACEAHGERGVRNSDAIACYHQARAKAATEMAAIVENTQMGG